MAPWSSYPPQLFDLSRNPSELLLEHGVDATIALTGHDPGPHERNLAHDPQYVGELARMEALLLEQMKLLDDPYRLWDQESAD